MDSTRTASRQRGRKAPTQVMRPASCRTSRAQARQRPARARRATAAAAAAATTTAAAVVGTPEGNAHATETEAEEPTLQENDGRTEATTTGALRNEFVDGHMKKIYYDLTRTSAYSSTQNLIREARGFGISAREVEHWLMAQEIYGRYKPARKKFPLNFYNIKGLHSVYEADLNDMRKLVDFNDGFNYFLTIICCLSRFVWVYPLKTKTGDEMASVFDRHFSETGQTCRLLQTDKGREFVAKSVQKIMKKYRIKYRTIDNAGKAAVAERVNRTLKTPLWKHMEHVNSWRWLEPLKQITHNYNHTVHRTTGMRPADVTERDVFRIWSTIYLRHTAPEFLQNERRRPAHRTPRDGRRPVSRRFKFNIGDFVRVSYTKDFTQKGYTAGFSREVYKVVGETRFSPFHMYTLADLNGEVLTGNFYGQELLRVSAPTTSTVYRIESVLQRRHRRGHPPEIRVRWQGYSKDFDSWITATEAQTI